MTKENIFICPVCRNTLSLTDKKLLCPENHSYDISREGYVNLLLPNMKRSSSPGDSPEMIRSRNRFLTGGYYSRLPELLSLKIKHYIQKKDPCDYSLLDAGCGEGYILSVLENKLNYNGFKFYGIDISRDAVKTAARRTVSTSCAVASLFSMPVADGSVNCLLNIFAPSPSAEFMRVLSPDGIILHVHPGDEHLYSLREKLFTEIIPLRKEDKLAESFTHQSIEELKYNFTITGKDNLSDLVNMTPYAWKTGKEKIARLITETTTLETTAHFIISIYRK